MASQGKHPVSDYSMPPLRDTKIMEKVIKKFAI
jgi:hypothetical protein